MFKHFFVLLSLSLLISSFSFGQSTNFTITSGYSFPSASSILGVERTYIDGYSKTMEENKNIYCSFGRGIEINGTIRRMLNENLGVELGFLYNFGSTYSLNWSNVSVNSKNVFFITSDNFSTHYWGINPAIILSSKINFLNPYVKFGALFGFPKMEEVYIDNYNSSPPINMEYSGNVSLGYTGAVGVALGNGWGRFTIEMKLISMVWNPAKVKVTSKLNNLSYEQILTDSNTFDPMTVNDGTKTLTKSVPFNSIGLNMGVQINL